MTIGYVSLFYFLPLAVAVFGWLSMREYGYPCLLRMMAYVLLREAEKSERSQVRHRGEIQKRIEAIE